MKRRINGDHYGIREHLSHDTQQILEKSNHITLFSYHKELLSDMSLLFF